MGDLLTTGSVLAAFLAGAVALFSPCCVTFLLPAYLAAAVKNRRWRLLPLTLVFGAGVTLVLLPVTLGIALVGSALARWHTPLYVAGGLLLLALGVMSVLGRSWSLPSLRAPSVERGDSAGLLALGIFSGVATSCCAPVLAGLVTLSALSAGPLSAIPLGLAYVFGMVFPLFLTALLWDRLRLGERRPFFERPVRLRIAGRSIVTSALNLAVGIAFATMGAVVLWLAATGRSAGTPGGRSAIGGFLSRLFDRVVSFLDPIPEPILGLGLLALAGLFVVAGLRGRSTDEGSCHDEQEGVEEEDVDRTPAQG